MQAFPGRRGVGPLQEGFTVLSLSGCLGLFLLLLAGGDALGPSHSSLPWPCSLRNLFEREVINVS